MQVVQIILWYLDSGCSKLDLEEGMAPFKPRSVSNDVWTKQFKPRSSSNDVCSKQFKPRSSSNDVCSNQFKPRFSNVTKTSAGISSSPDP
ncbi:hypothetical protein Tco_0311126 [Tanacetum coccineum]